MYCMKCGTEIPEGANFCPSCGASALPSEAPAPQPVSVQQPAAPQPSQVQPPVQNFGPGSLPQENPAAQSDFRLFGRTISMRTGLIALGLLVVLMFLFANC